MREGTLTREDTNAEGTFGELVLDDGFKIFTGELPDRHNLSGKSCIPTGKYICVFRDSPKHGLCYHVEKVPDRTDIQIHSANWMGDSDQGFKCQLLGCIAPGKSKGALEGQNAVLESKKALRELEDNLNRENFMLTIRWK